MSGEGAMAEYACRSCGKQVSVETESCPNCGTPYPAEGEKTARKLTMQAVGSAAKGEPVHITDIDIPFWSMVVFMVKWAIASIPALLILFLFGALVAGALGGLVAGLLNPFG